MTIRPDSTETAEAAQEAQEGPGASRSSNSPETGPEAAVGRTAPREEASTDHSQPADRPNTPDRANPDGSTTITQKRACNGCGALLGDVTDHEMSAAIAGRPLPDVRRECPACGPTAPEPRCLPVQVAAGEGYCLIGDCDHDIALDAEYCVEVRTETICSIHSTFAAGFEDMHEVVTHSEPWPCKHAAVTA